jgi:Mlc titration factor MtfA (ptsG expression regulator)
MLLLLGSAMLLAGWFLSAEWRAGHGRDRLRQQPFPAAWRRILQRRVPYIRAMPADLQLQLKRQIKVFLAQTPIIGCNGLTVTDEMRVTIAAQACLLVLHRRDGGYPNLRQILLYPGAFIVDRVHGGGDGVLREERRVLAGESWQRGQVILSWQDTLEGAAITHDGRNVVLHEFAHQLDQETGAANGAPRLPRAASVRWAQVLGAEFQQLRQRVENGQSSLLSDYGATDPAEFFAVVTEVFFEQPAQLAQDHAALFGELRSFYGIDPLSW